MLDGKQGADYEDSHTDQMPERLRTCEPVTMPTNWYKREQRHPRVRRTYLSIVNDGGLTVNIRMYLWLRHMAWREQIDQFGAGR